jgi:prepilin peptidase CpaA
MGGELPAPRGLVLVVLCAALVAVVISDARQRRIPNAIVLAIAGGGLVHAVAACGARGAVASLCGAGLGVALLLWQFQRGLMGAGDVKLLGALGGWTGAAGVVRILLVGTVLGGVLALVWLLLMSRRERQGVGRNLRRLGERELPPTVAADPRCRRGIPYGIALALSGAGVLSLGVGQ